MNILGIESSCDETGLAIYNEEKGILANIIYSQIKLHEPYGGVIPELAARDHIRTFLPLLEETLKEAQLTKKDLNGIAFTAGPGLMGAVLTGAMFARTLAFALQLPAIEVHHLEAHLLAPLLEAEKPSLPFLALLVSGGHTQLIAVKRLGEYQIIGETLDDAAGEAFDKTAKLLGLPYPGGAPLAALAEKGISDRFTFPRPMLNKPNFDFSFSGLKTAALTAIRSCETLDEQTRSDIAKGFEEAVVETLVTKTIKAAKELHFHSIVIAGGVGANKYLRQRLKESAERENLQVFYPRLSYCTDNGAMVAYAGYLRLNAGQKSDLAVRVKARWDITNLESIFS